MPLTREQMIAELGVDPEEEGALDKLNASKGGGVIDHLKSAAVGAATIPTDFINLFPTVTGAAGAAIRSYTQGTPFMEEFQKQQEIPEADANRQKHFQEIAAAWKQQNPALSEADILAGLQDYQKTKEYEDFALQQKGGTHWLAAKAKDVVRGALGDERPDSERSWTEGAAEAIGGALVPGPTGWANTARAAVTGVPVIGRAANSAIGRGTLRTAEIFTPLTMPYTGTNVAINATAGVALDQASRGLQGRPTAFTPDATDDHGIGALAATGGVAAALGAVIAATRGRTHALQGAQLSDAARALQQPNMAPVDSRIANPVVPGQASVSAGDPRQLTPNAHSDDIFTPIAAKRHLETQTMDEAASTVDAVRDVNRADQGGSLRAGRAEANEMEQIFSDNFTSVLQDRVRGSSDATVRPIEDAVAAAPGGANGPNARGVLEALRAHSQVAKRDILHDSLLDQVRRAQANLQRLTQQGANRMRLAMAQRTLRLRRADFQRVAQDVPSARTSLPEFDMPRMRHLANQVARDQRPFVVAIRNAVSRAADDAARKLLNVGKIDQATYTAWRTRNPYHIPLMDDPLQGLGGIRRMWRGLRESFKDTYAQEHSNAASVVGHESAIHSLDRSVRQGASQTETRVTHPLDVMTSLRLYHKYVDIDVALTYARNAGVRALAVDPVYGGPSSFQLAGKVRPVTDVASRQWYGRNMLQTSDFVKEALRKADTVIEWHQGRFRLWQLGDVDMARVMRHQPHTYSGMVRFGSEMSKWFKYFTTGFGNPAFAPKAAMYNLVVGMVTKPVGRAFGRIDTALRHILPERVANQTLGRVVDPTAIVEMPWHAIRGIAEVMADNSFRWLRANLHAESGAFGVLRQALGQPAYDALLRGATRAANYTHELHSIRLRDAGMVNNHSIHQGVRKASDAYDVMNAQIPSVMRSMYGFYKDVINQIYLAPQRMFYTQNYGLLSRRYGGRIPQWEMDRLINETRHLGGDMTKVAGSKLMRDFEAVTPYLTQTKLGTYHLLRNMTSPETAHIVWPRLVTMMGAIGTSLWWRTTWNEESARNLWQETSANDIWRYVDVPHPKLLIQGWDTPFSRDMYWKLPIAPDFAGMIAATGALAQAMGALPSGITPRPLAEGVWPTFADNLMPGMPPAFQALLAAGGIKLDPQTADTRGGNIFRSFNQNFRAGPQAEAASNLGQATNTQMLLANALGGAMGSHIAQGIEVLMHAAKFDSSIRPGNVLTQRQSMDFGKGLNAALTTTFKNVTKNIPDVVPLWSGKQKYSVMTPSWQYVQESNNHIRSVAGARDTSLSPTNQARRARDVQIGGTPVNPVTNRVLLQISNEVADFSKETGPLGQLRKAYRDYSKDAAALKPTRGLPPEVQQERVDKTVQAQQANMKQQQIAIQYMEQELAKKYGQVLAPLLRGQEFSMKTLDQLMHMDAGGAPPDEAAANQ